MLLDKVCGTLVYLTLKIYLSIDTPHMWMHRKSHTHTHTHSLSLSLFHRSICHASQNLSSPQLNPCHFLLPSRPHQPYQNEARRRHHPPPQREPCTVARECCVTVWCQRGRGLWTWTGATRPQWHPDDAGGAAAWQWAGGGEAARWLRG